MISRSWEKGEEKRGLSERNSACCNYRWNVSGDCARNGCFSRRPRLNPAAPTGSFRRCRESGSSTAILTITRCEHPMAAITVTSWHRYPGPVNRLRRCKLRWSTTFSGGSSTTSLPPLPQSDDRSFQECQILKYRRLSSLAYQLSPVLSFTLFVSPVGVKSHPPFLAQLVHFSILVSSRWTFFQEIFHDHGLKIIFARSRFSITLRQLISLLRSLERPSEAAHVIFFFYTNRVSRCSLYIH